MTWTSNAKDAQYDGDDRVKNDSGGGEGGDGDGEGDEPAFELGS